MGDHSHHDHGHAGHNHDPVEHRGSDDFGTVLPDSGTTATPTSLHHMMMSMFFHTGVKETILFESWETTDVLSLLGSMLAIFFLAFLYEALKFYREHLYRHSFRTIQYNTVSVPAENGGTLKETQKIVQIGMHSVSVDPKFEPDEITPIFISQNTCTCPGPSNPNPEESVGPVASTACPHMSQSYALPENNNTPSCTSAGSRIIPGFIPTSVHHAYKVRMLSLMHTWQTTLHVVQVILSYFLMLIFMTYNIWLCLAVVLGAGAGYFFFGWKKSLVVDITEHCH